MVGEVSVGPIVGGWGGAVAAVPESMPTGVGRGICGGEGKVDVQAANKNTIIEKVMALVIGARDSITTVGNGHCLGPYDMLKLGRIGLTSDYCSAI
jgi:hypothetical protein